MICSQVLEGLRSFTAADALRNNVPANTVIGVFRDLRGMLEATVSERYYGKLAAEKFDRVL